MSVDLVNPRHIIMLPGCQSLARAGYSPSRASLENDGFKEGGGCAFGAARRHDAAKQMTSSSVGGSGRGAFGEQRLNIAN